MSLLYVETSAVLSWLFGEPDAAAVIEATEQSELVVSSTLTVVETERALHRAGRMHQINEATAARLLKWSVEQFRTWELLDITREIQERAGKRFPIEPIRTLDALHLATMLRFVEVYGELTALSLNKRIVDNLALLGLDCRLPAGPR